MKTKFTTLFFLKITPLKSISLRGLQNLKIMIFGNLIVVAEPTLEQLKLFDCLF
jgi:hypothetical protein